MTRSLRGRHGRRALAFIAAGTTALALVTACGSSGGSAASAAAPASAAPGSSAPAGSAPGSSAPASSAPAPSANDPASSSAPASAASQAAGVPAINTSPADDPAAAAVAAISSDPALTSALPEDIQKNGIKVATSVPYPPMEIFAKDGKTPIGVDPDVARAIGNRLGIKIDLINVDDFNAQIPGIISGRYDMVASSVTDTKEREGKLTFVDYLSDGQGFLVKGGNPEGISQPSDLCGKILAVVDNGSALELGEQISSDCTKAGSKAVKILKFTGDSDAILAVQSGRAAADIEDYPVAAYHAQTSSGKLDAVQIHGGEAPLGLGIKADNDALIQGVQKALASMIADGTYKAVLDAWDVGAMAVTSAETNGAK